LLRSPRWANDGKIEPLAASDIAIENFAGAHSIEQCPRSKLLCRRQRRTACMRAICRGKDGKRAIPNPLEHVAACLFRRSVGDSREPSQSGIATRF